MTAPALSERDFQAQVIELAETLGYRCYHTHDSRRSREGWPDLAMWKIGRFLLAELKTERGHLQEMQLITIAQLRAAGVEAHIWRPRDWDKIVATLRREP